MQIQEKVNAANFLSVGMGTGKKGNNDQGIEGADFASFLNNSDQANDQVGLVSAEKELFPERSSVNTKTETRNVKTDNRDNKAAADNRNVKTDNKTASSNVKENDTKVSGTTGNITEGNALDAEELEEVAEVIGDVLLMVMNQFDLTIEDIQASLDKLGLNAGDLLNAEDAKAFFFDIEGVDVSAVLTDENLNNELQNFLSEIEDIVGLADVSPELIEEAVEQHSFSLDEIPLSEDKPKNKINDFDDSSKDDYVPVADTAKEDSDIGPKVTVEVENDNNDHGFKHTSERKTGNAHSENRTDMTNPVLQGINDAMADVSEVNQVPEANVRPAEIVEQIVEQIRVNINQENTTMEMQLYPEHLGRIQIHVVSKDGVMTARIAAETEAAKQAIEAGLNNLKESFNNQNLKVDAIEVMVSTTAFANGDQNKEQYQQENAGRRNGKGGIGLGDIDDVSEDEEAENQKMQAEGSSVSYRA